MFGYRAKTCFCLQFISRLHLLLPSLTNAHLSCHLFTQSGQSQERLKGEFRDVLRRVAQVYPPSKLLIFVKVRQGWRQCVTNPLQGFWTGCCVAD